MSDPDPRKDRTDEAATTKAEAEAAKAKADAAKADARRAEAAARKAEQEVADHDTAAATRLRDAEARKNAAEADKDAATARRAQYTALIPDLSSVKDSTLDLEEGPPLWSSFLLSRAVDAAARTVAGNVKAREGETSRVLLDLRPRPRERRRHL